MSTKDEEERPDDGSRSRKTRTEIIDHAALTRATAAAFEAGGSSARAIIDAQGAALVQAYAEIARLHASHGVAFSGTQAAIDKSQGLVNELREVASQNVALTLVKNQGRTDEIEAVQAGETKRHAMTLLGTSPYLGVVLEKVLPLVLPGAKVTLPRAAGPGDTPREAAERFAASLRSGGEHAKNLLENLELYCAEVLERPGDFALLVQFLGATLGGSVETPATPAPEPAPEAAA